MGCDDGLVQDGIVEGKDESWVLRNRDGLEEERTIG